MPNIVRFKKPLFWFLLTAALALAVLPSIVLLESLQQYLQFLSAWNPGTIRQTKTHTLPHR